MALLPTLVADHSFRRAQNHWRRATIPQVIILGSLIPVNTGILAILPWTIRAPIALIALMATSVTTLVVAWLPLLLVVTATSALIPTRLLWCGIPTRHKEGLVSPFCEHDHVFERVRHM